MTADIHQCPCTIMLLNYMHAKPHSNMSHVGKSCGREMQTWMAAVFALNMGISLSSDPKSFSICFAISPLGGS